MLPFLGSVLHMLTYSLPAILGPVGAGEEEVLDDDDDEQGLGDNAGGVSGQGGDNGVHRVGEPPRSGAQATATYYAAVQVDVCGLRGVRGEAW